jgi:hypothetical protein
MLGLLAHDKLILAVRRMEMSKGVAGNRRVELRWAWKGNGESKVRHSASALVQDHPIRGNRSPYRQLELRHLQLLSIVGCVVIFCHLALLTGHGLSEREGCAVRGGGDRGGKTREKR